MANPLLSAALCYANLGLSVFPLTPRNKTPLTEHGFKDATINTALIREWWQKYPTANIGIYCRGLLVLDFDEQTGYQSKCRLEKDYQPLPNTWKIKTGGGTIEEPKEPGRQYIYRVLPETEIKPGAGKYGYPNLDVRAGESYIVAVPSVTRLAYQTIAGSPENIAQAPQWLIEFVLNGNKSTAQHTKSAESKIPIGQRNDYLFRLASGLRARGLSEATILDSVRSAYENDCAHCDSDGKPVPMDDKELRTITKQGAKYKPKKTDISLICIAEVEPESVSWLWPPYIPKGKVTLVEGDPGIGKSFVSLAIATAVTLGKGLPEQEATEPANVVMASAEDGLGDTIRPRLDAMGADISRIFAIDGALTLDETGFALLESYLDGKRPALLIIDPLVAYLGAGVDIHRANETRAVMSQLARLAEKFDTAILAVRHLTKGGMSKAIYRGLGSIDFTAACRSVLLAGCDTENPQSRALVHIKSNLAPAGPAIGYELRDGGFYWTGESTLTAAQILAADNGAGTSELDEAMTFLKDELADGEVPAKDIYQTAHDTGIAKRTLERAKAKLQAKSRKIGDTWFWCLTESTSPTSPIQKFGELENIEAKKEGMTEGLGDLDHETALGMTVGKALELWRSKGAPLIHLGPGENCLDLEKLLSRLDVKPAHLKAVADWLIQRS